MSPSEYVLSRRVQEARSRLVETSGTIAEIGIAPTIPALQPSAFDEIIRAAFKEANSTYAVPKYMSYDEAEQVLAGLSGHATNI